MPLQDHEHRSSVLLRIGCSPDKEGLLRELGGRFESFRFRVDDQSIDVEVVPIESQELVEAVLGGKLEIVCPDSIVQVEQIEDKWRQKNEQRGIVEEIAKVRLTPTAFAASLLDLVIDGIWTKCL